MSTPETIYLIPGEYEEGLVWCDDPAPDSYSDPDEAVKYVRADTLPVVTDNGKVNVGLIAENERLQARVADLEQAASVSEWIKCSDRLPDVLDVWIKMTDGSVVACWSKLDGDFYWNGGGSESYILENTVTHRKPRQQEQGHE